jgi:Bacterial Ig-like domain (group 3)/FG-GAP-like repeat/FG-GAP repeat
MATKQCWRALFLLSCLLLAARRDAEASGFKLRTPLIPVDSGPASVAVADFNGDGKLDLAVASYSANSNISVLLGNGDGTFQPKVDYPVGSQPFGVAIGDFNLDGKPDLVVANSLSNSISVLLGNGDGTFQAAMSFATGQFPISVVVGDFNNDGIPDVATANNFGCACANVLLGNGDGTFQPALYQYVSSTVYSIAVGDFNGDGKLDLAIGEAFGAAADLEILLGNGDGTFHSIGTFPLLTVPQSIAVADFNHDGALDVAVATFGGGVDVLLGNGDGTFKPAVNYQAGFTYAVAIADFNRDGNSDLAVADFVYPSQVSVLIGKGDGTFQTAVSYNTQGKWADAVAAADLNGDNSPDLIVANRFSDNLSILLNSGGTRMSTNSSPNPSHLGQSVTFSTGVSASIPGTGVPTGTITFKDGSTNLGTVALVSGKARLTTSGLTSGKHQIVADYSGDQTFNRNRAKPVVQVVNP